MLCRPSTKKEKRFGTSSTGYSKTLPIIKKAPVVKWWMPSWLQYLWYHKNSRHIFVVGKSMYLYVIDYSKFREYCCTAVIHPLLKKELKYKRKFIQYMIQGTWAVYTEILNLKGLQMAINKYKIIHWWLLMGASKSFCWQTLLKTSLSDMIEWSWNGC